jgi:Ca-activated chloride channel family protein
MICSRECKLRMFLFILIAVPFLGATLAAQQKPAIKVDVDLVQVNVTVTDSQGRYVAGLDKSHFQIWEDRVAQQVEHFGSQDVPLSVGLIFDGSGSMSPMLSYARQAALAFLEIGEADDEYFLVVFNDRPHLTVDLTKDISRLQSHIFTVPAKGSTALYDAVYMGMEKLKSASNPKRALIAITDGEENRSRYTFTNLKEFVKEQNVQIFSIGAWGPINNLVELTGGYAFHGPGLVDICQKIAVELKNEYVLSYRSTNEAKNGAWRKIQVRVNAPPGLGKLSVRNKTGYYGPSV